MLEELLIFTSVVMVFGTIFIVRRKIIYDVFEPTTIFGLFLILFFLNNAVFFEYDYTYLTAFIIFFGTVSYLFGFYAVPSPKKHFPRYIPDGIGFRKFIIFSLAISAINFSVLIIKIATYGYSLDAYLGSMLVFHGENIKQGGYVWLALTKPVHFLFLVVSFAYVSKERTVKSIIFTFIMYLVFKASSLSVSRWSYIQALLFPILLYMRFIIGKPKFKLTYLLPVAFIPPLMIILNSFRHGRYGEIETTFFQAGIESLKGDSNPGRHFDYFINYIYENDLFHHGWFVLTQTFSIIPRVIWEDKPITSALFYYTKQIFNIDPVVDGTTYTFTVFDFAAISGFSSLIIGMIFFGWFSKLVYNSVYKTENALFFSFSTIFLLNYINTLRGSFLDQLSFFILDAIILCFMFYIALGVGFVKRRLF